MLVYLFLIFFLNTKMIIFSFFKYILISSQEKLIILTYLHLSSALVHAGHSLIWLIADQ